ncbi:MAG: hypothetical protein WAT39_05575 [Planctomycetota bacterium]
MSTPSRRIAVLLTLAAVTAALRAQGTPIGFEETYALAPDRAKAVATLIPGSDDWCYWHCRERLDAGDFAAVRTLLPVWTQRHGRHDRAIEIEYREALLSFAAEPERSFALLRRELGYTFAHQPIVPGAVSDLPTRLDPGVLSGEALTRVALERSPESVDAFTDAALPALAAQALNPRQLRSLLQRLRRPDVDNLPALVVRDLEERGSGGFGSFEVHRLLRRAQLEECVRLRPGLLQDGRFVRAYLVRLQPGADVSWQDDPAARAAQLRRLWEFAQRLPPAFNSLKAHVLFHWLQHDLTQGAPDKERFLAYIRLPRRSGVRAEQYLKQFARGDEHVDLRVAYPTGLPAIGDDEALLRACLEHWFASEDGIDAYAEFLDANWLKVVLAETKLLLGQGDPERWYALLADPARLEALKQRIEITFPPTLPVRHGADDAVRLEVDTKNVPTLLLKVFAIDAFRYHVEKQKEVDATIDLDGVIANFEQTFSYDEPPLRRVRRTFELPMLREPGTYVVELVGNGTSSRAVIHKGALRLAERTAAGGQLVTVFDETGRAVPAAMAWFGGREYLPDERGNLLLPFSTAPGVHRLVLRAGNRSSIVPFEHRAERYELTGAAHVEREALVAGGKARIVVRPQLRLTDHDVGLALWKDRVLTVVATDRDGLATTMEVRDPALVDEREFVHEIAVPERLAAIAVSLRGTVKDLAGQDVAVATPATSFPVNGIDATAETGSAVLLATEAGYVVEVRGKNGEVLAGRTCALQLAHQDLREAIAVSLQTDGSGRIALGRLPGVLAVSVQRAGGTGGRFELRPHAARMPRALHGRAGDVLRLPYQGSAQAPSRAEFSLLGLEADMFANLAIADGFVELRGLPAGDYALHDHRTGALVPVRVTAGERDRRWLVGRERILAASSTAPLHVRSVRVEGGELRIALANVTSATRVHVVATRHLPTFDPFALAGAPARAPGAFVGETVPSSYHSGRKLGDEYRYVLERRFAPKFAGNMLTRPSLLLNPWLLEETTNEAVGLGGGAGGRFGGRRSGGAPGASPAPQHSAAGLEPNPGTFASFDWLPRGSSWLANLTPGDDGMVRVPAADLGDGQHVHVVALDGDQAIHESLVRSEVAVAPRSRTLPRALDTAAHFVEQRRIEFVAAGGTAVLADARSAEVEIHDSLASVFRLLNTISRDPELAKFAFVTTWPTRTMVEKQQLYRQHACHELHFFLSRRDPEFFAAVVKPFLAQKLEKTFLDHWLLGDDLKAFLEPWRFAQLNLIERILLAQRLDEAGRGAIARAIREALELRPVSIERIGELFAMALKSEELADKGGADHWLGGLRQAQADPRPSGPTTGVQPPAAAKAGAPERERRAEAKNEARKDAAEDAKLADELQAGEPADKEKAAELDERGRARLLYRAVAKTKLVVEQNWWHRGMAAATPDAVAPNQFWVDYATAPAGQPFASTAIVQASTSFLEMMMALAVLDLPFTAGKHEITADGDSRTLRAASPLLLVRKEVSRTERVADQAPLLLGENFFRLDDRYRVENGERRDAFVTDEFLVDVGYGCQVVVTNPTSMQRTAEVLLQIPAGAVPLQNGFWTKGRTVQLAPYATATIEYAFYFPGPGSFAHYPAHAAEKGKLAANAEPRTLAVVATPSRIDTTSWEHVSQQGSPAQVLAFLDTHNVQGLELAKIAWRMKDREFFTQTLAKLRARHVFDDTLWSYGILHRDVQSTREHLERLDGFVARCGMALSSPLLTIEPRERRAFQHVELDPLVHPRAHRLGSQRVIGNADLARQYSSLMTLLGYHPKLDADDWLVVSYYLFLQDRIEEGLAAFAKVDAERIAAKLQYDYLAAWTCFFTGDVQRARTLAQRHQDHPVLHWQQRFRDVLTQLDAAAGRSGAGDEPTTDQAAQAPSLELAIADRTVNIAHRNLAQCEVRYYELDVEFAFSAQPFAGKDGASAAFVRPNLQETRDLGTGATTSFPLPAQFWQKNVLVEVRGAGLVRSQQYFANALAVRFLESWGQVAVTAPDTQAPLPKTYVKVFAKLPDGTVRFHKDGYTDLRGRFDYASLSDDPNAGASRYAVLVLDEQRGAVIREVAPPAK